MAGDPAITVAGGMVAGCRGETIIRRLEIHDLALLIQI
jgi:hypothetical protein